MARGFGKMTMDKLGRLYAERVLRNARLRPEEMPELANRIDWKEAGEWVRDEILRDIRLIAQDLLIASGHTRERVMQILR